MQYHTELSFSASCYSFQVLMANAVESSVSISAYLEMGITTLKGSKGKHLGSRSTDCFSPGGKDQHEAFDS